MTLLAVSPVRSADNAPFPLEPHSLPAQAEGDRREIESFMLNQRVLRNVSQPTLTPFLADAKNNTGIGVIVAPGGGFKILSIDREGTEVARWLNRRGINAFVLKYRLDETAPSDWLFKLRTGAAVGWSVLGNLFGSGPTDYPEAPLADVQERAIDDALAALELVNDRAREWGLRPDAIGMLGFSAGGAIATGTAMVGRDESRPDFVASIYGVPHVADIPDDGPPLFLLFAEDDPLVPPEWSRNLHRRWQEQGLDSTLVSYPEGGHGFGMKARDEPTDDWIEVFHRWLTERFAVVPASGDIDRDSARDWSVYGGDNANTHYSVLAQIDRDNVDRLEVAWHYRSARGEPLPAASELQVNPIVVDGVLYGRNPNYNVFALDAATGEELWTFTPAREHVGLSNMRGVTFWRGLGAGGERVSRILFTTSHYLFALDAETGRPVEQFGEDGVVDLRRGLDRDPEKIAVSVPSPGVIHEGRIILGSTVAETDGAAPGDIRAYDVLTGERVWTFHTIPRPGEFGYDTWPEGAWRSVGGANAWAGQSLDSERGVVYVPTGSPAPDFDGSVREGANLFGNSVIALDAATGERLWHFQTVHHDMWDRDLSAPPALVTVHRDGAQRDMVAQVSKQGVVYLLDRDTGEPVFPIEEVPVPASDIPGQHAYPTQPRVTLPQPFTRQAFTPDMITDITPEAHAFVKEQYDEAQPFAWFRPIGLEKTILFPGFYGGANWGGGAYDPATNLFYINAMEAPSIVNYEKVEVDKGSELGFGQFIYQKYCGGCHGPDMGGFYPYAPSLHGISERTSKNDAMDIVVRGKGRMMAFNQLSRHEHDAVLHYIYTEDRARVHGDTATEQAENGATGDEPVEAAETETTYMFGGYTPFVDDRYYPAVKPPWGTLTAIDLATGEHRWQIPLGEYEQLTEEGVPPTGTLNYGGPVVTAGGLLIIAATADEYLRIFDKASGELLWRYKLPAAGYSTPSTYAVDGVQYIVVACTGGKLGTPTGDDYIAFRLAEGRAETARED